MRSRIFDDALRPWPTAHPGGTVVELAAGLETQFQPSERCKHIARSALDFGWFDEIGPARGVFVSAHGLLMSSASRVSGRELDGLLRSGTPRIATVTTQPYGFARGPGRGLVWICGLSTPLQNIAPAIAHVATRPGEWILRVMGLSRRA